MHCVCVRTHCVYPRAHCVRVQTQCVVHSDQGADVTAQASDGAESASDEIEADSIGKKATIRKSLTQKPPDRMTTPKGNRSADGTSIVEKGVRRLSAATGKWHAPHGAVTFFYLCITQKTHEEVSITLFVRGGRLTCLWIMIEMPDEMEHDVAGQRTVPRFGAALGVDLVLCGGELV